VKKRILVVEDDGDMQKIYRKVLSTSYDVTLVSNVDEAWKSLWKNTPDLIILDILLPKNKMGDEFYLQIRQHSSCSSIPVIVVSVLDEKSSGEMLKKVNNVFWITKPFEEKQLLDKIGEMLSGVGRKKTKK